MSTDLTRRDLISRTVPALAAGATVLAGLDVLAQENPAAPAEPQFNVLKMIHEAQKDGLYTLPKLPYAYDALEPHIDAQTMELHHGKHHQAYVTNLNKAIDALAKLRDEPEIDPAKLSALSRDISFNAGGHIFHTVFFGILGKTPEITIPEINIKMDIIRQYGSLEKFQAHFSKVAAGVKGSGWAIAFYEPLADKILITETGDQDQRLIPGSAPILLIDVWEHAYYLKYQNKRADYIKAFWNVVNWLEVDAIYTHVRALYKKK